MATITNITKTGGRTSANIDGIQFNRIINSGIGNPNYWITQAGNNLWEASTDSANNLAQSVNAVDINWNAAQVDENVVINSTGELLSWIKSNMNNIDNEKLAQIENTMQLYQAAFSAVVTKTYADEHYQEKGDYQAAGDYVNSEEYAEDIAELNSLLETLSGQLEGYNIPNLTTRLQNIEAAQSNYLTQASLANYATKSYVDDKFTDLIGNAPTTLDTIHEIAEALNDNATMSQVAQAIETKANSEDVYRRCR